MSSLPPRILDYLRLARLPNVFTAIADIWMGFLVVQGSFEPLGLLVLLTLATASLYTAGMVLNDVFDLEIDREERPERPLPSGRIPMGPARKLGFSLLAAGWTSAAVVSLLLMSGTIESPNAEGNPPWAWGPILVATLLAGCIVSYNAGVKRTWWGPMNMGACRTLNILLGMSLAPSTADSWLAGWGAEHLTIALAIGIYIMGVTWFARGKAGTSSRVVLAWGTAWMGAGWILLGSLPSQIPAGVHLTLQPLHWQLLLLLLAVPVFRRAAVAWSDPSPTHVQAGVKQFIVSLIVLDATVVLLLVDPALSIVVLALLVPMLLLGRWVYST
jgi:4-hydroxybenzoate polyprenyltransferase